AVKTTASLGPRHRAPGHDQMIPDYYETDRAVAEYLLFHYGAGRDVMPHRDGPAAALEFPVRCVTECLSPAAWHGRAPDPGCAVGRSTFELARHCMQVVGVDFSARFIAAANRLRAEG